MLSYRLYLLQFTNVVGAHQRVSVCVPPPGYASPDFLLLPLPERFANSGTPDPGETMVVTSASSFLSSFAMGNPVWLFAISSG